MTVKQIRISKSEILNKSEIRITKIQNDINRWTVFCFEHLNFEHSILFRISNFDIRICF